jgi:hypothetical protein
MRKSYSAPTGLAAVLMLIAALGKPVVGQSSTAAVDDINPPVANCNTTPDTIAPAFTAPTPIAASLLTPGQPCQQVVHITGPSGDDSLANRQRGFDFYSWLTFIAMNSPPGGKIGAGSMPGGDAKTVWESLENYRPLADIMLKDGAKPEWGTRIVPDKCKPMDQPEGEKIIVQLAEEAFNQPFKTGPLIDQDGNYALFDILMNKPMFSYILDNGLYSKNGQQAFNGEVEFPIGNSPVNKPDGTVGTPGRMGAIMLKVSYRILDPVKNKDIISQFHTRDALVYFPGPPATKEGPACVEKKLGLIGFHVGHKTKFAPQWVWTSFEHVSNVPDEDDIKSGNLLKRYNFFKAKCDGCARNDTPLKPWDPPLSLQFATAFRSQVVRQTMLPRHVLAEVADLNKQFQALLKGTVWENYMLLSTQWPSEFDSPTDPLGAPAPTYLANSTLETFSQGKVPLASSSCMACHGNAVNFQRSREVDAKTIKSFNQSDFTFTLEKAQ